MAGEITASFTLVFNKSGRSETWQWTGVKSDMNDTHLFVNVQDIGTAAVSVSFSEDQTTTGYAQFVNMHDTRYVQLGVNRLGVFCDFCHLEPGEVAQYPVSTMVNAELQAKAENATTGAATVQLQVRMLPR